MDTRSSKMSLTMSAENLTKIRPHFSVITSGL